MKVVTRAFNSLTTRLQITTFFMSVVGIAFSCKSYFAFKDIQPDVGSQLFFDLEMQVLIALIAQIIAWRMISWMVVKPIVTLIEIMRELGDNHYDIDIPYTTFGDQIGSFARKVAVFKDRCIAMHKLEEEKTATKAKTEAQRIELRHSLSASFNANVNSIFKN